MRAQGHPAWRFVAGHVALEVGQDVEEEAQQKPEQPERIHGLREQSRKDPHAQPNHDGELTRFLRALMRGELLAPAEMTEMMRSVPATELEGIVPGVRYGLGLMEVPGSCGAPYFSHFGDTFGFSKRDAVSVDGERAVVVSLSANVAGEAVLDVLTTSLQLLDDAMCLAP